jgi:hypothetical protein
MMDNFSQTLQCFLTTTNTSSSSNYFGGTALFKVQVNLDIPMFEGKKDVDSLEK